MLLTKHLLIDLYCTCPSGSHRWRVDSMSYTANMFINRETNVIPHDAVITKVLPEVSQSNF